MNVCVYLGGDLQCKKGKSLNSPFQRTFPSRRSVEGAAAGAVVLGREDEGGQPQIREDDVNRERKDCKAWDKGGD